MRQIKFSIIVPAHNEEETIGEVLAELKEIPKNDFQDYEIIVIDDGSTDKTAEIIETISGIKTIKHSHNKGYGAALKTGIKNSENEWIIIIDADGTYPINSIPEFIKNTGKYDLIVGSRETKNNAIPFGRKHAKKFLNKFAGYLAGKKIPDLNSGLRMFRKEIILKYWELFPNKFSFTSTLTMVCLTHGYDTKFIPIDYHKRKGKSSIKPVDFFNFLKLVLKLSLFFKPIKVFVPISALIFSGALLVAIFYFTGITSKFFDATFIILCATALQTFFFGLLAEIVIHNK